MKIDDIDLNILAELQKDSRLSIRELSKKINLSPPSVTERVRRLEDNGVIKGYTIKIDKKALGIKIQCILEITLKDYNYETSPAFIVNHPNCEACYRIAGDSCYIVILSVSNFEEVETFVKFVSPRATTKTKFVFAQLDVCDDIKKLFVNPAPISKI